MEWVCFGFTWFTRSSLLYGLSTLLRQCVIQFGEQQQSHMMITQSVPCGIGNELRVERSLPDEADDADCELKNW